MPDPTHTQGLLLSQVRDKVEACFGYRPCLWQIHVVQALLKNDKGRYRAIVTNIETISKPGGGFDKLWLDKDFGSKVLNLVWDEAQCVSRWGEFRPEYKTAGNLWHIIPRTI
jgi:superfamily II DNA helicase RecQ